MSNNPIICALDTTDQQKALELAKALKGHVGAIKLGLEFFTYNGVAGVRMLEEAGMPIFLDLKFHDIPNTVSRAIKALSGLNIFMTTVHTSGGKRMMSDAAHAIEEAFRFAHKPSVVGVTILTSLDAGDLDTIGMHANIADQVKRLARLAHDSGLNGIVCSPHEISMIRTNSKVPQNFKLVVPGIRPAGSAAGDQKRVMTPKQAMDAGATYLVIGRPITEAEHPAKAAQAIVESL